MRFYILLSLVALGLFVSACSDALALGNVEEGVEMPRSTLILYQHFDSCGYDKAEKMGFCNDQMVICMISKSEAECLAPAENCRKAALDVYDTCMHNIPEVQLPSGEQCVIDLSNPDLSDRANNPDADGDGVPDYFEVYHDRNPCHTCTFGGIDGQDCDGDEDFDKDGIPNRDDPTLACPGDVFTVEDCV